MESVSENVGQPGKASLQAGVTAAGHSVAGPSVGSGAAAGPSNPSPGTDLRRWRHTSKTGDGTGAVMRMLGTGCGDAAHPREHYTPQNYGLQKTVTFLVG